MAAEYYTGTITPFGDGFDDSHVETTVRKLKKAFKGLGTNEKALIDVLVSHSNMERQVIKQMFKSMYGQDLVNSVRDELSGDFEDLCVNLLMQSRFYTAVALHKAMQDIGTKEVTLIDILCSKSNSEMADIKKAYLELYSRELEEAIHSETSGHFHDLLVALLQGNRSEDQTLDDEAVQKDAKELFDAGEGQLLSTDEDTFIHLLGMRSVGHLRAMFDEYKVLSTKDIMEAIDGETSGDFQNTLHAIVGYIRSPCGFFAKCLHDSMCGLGTDDERLMYLVVSHSEVDLQHIGEAYMTFYNKSLVDEIKGECSGDYKKLMVQLVTPNDKNAANKENGTKDAPDFTKKQ